MRHALTAAVLLALSFTAAAQAPPSKFELNKDRIDLTSEDTFADSKTYLIPTVYLHLAARNATFVKHESARATARVVTPMEKAYAQGLAKQAQDDLVAKIRAAGFTVLTYDDVKADLAGFDRMKDNPEYGLPTRLIDSTPGIDFAIAAPSDEQAFDYSFATGPVFQFRKLAKEKNLVVIVPQVFLTMPEVASQTSSHALAASVALTVVPALKLHWAWVFAQSGGDAGNIRIQRHGGRTVTENVGTLQKVAETNDAGDWKGKTGDFTLTLDKAAFSDGVLRVAQQVNDFTVATIRDEH